MYSPVSVLGQAGAGASRRPVVVKLSGTPIDDPGLVGGEAGGLWGALAEADGANELVIVHGGGRAVDRRLAQLGLESERVNGLRVTPEGHIGPIAGVLAGEINVSLVGRLCALGPRAVGMGLSDAGLCRCEAVEGLGRVGRIVGGDPMAVAVMLGAGLLPVIHSIGLDGSGRPLNVNADDAAAGVAGVIWAERVVFITDVHGVLDGRGEPIASLTAREARGLIASGVASAGMIPKLEAACRAAALGVEAVIGCWSEAAELIAGAGAGTRVMADEDGERGVSRAGVAAGQSGSAAATDDRRCGAC